MSTTASKYRYRDELLDVDQERNARRQLHASVYDKQDQQGLFIGEEGHGDTCTGI